MVTGRGMVLVAACETSSYWNMHSHTHTLMFVTEEEVAPIYKNYPDLHKPSPPNLTANLSVTLLEKTNKHIIQWLSSVCNDQT